MFYSGSPAVIGPPAVSMVLRDGVMELNITDPEYKICNLSHVWLNDVAYNITYWRQHQQNEVKLCVSHHFKSSHFVSKQR